MKRTTVLNHKFVECIPDRLEEGIIYISMLYATAAHKCCCGCGSEVITPFSPTDWKLIFDGETVSLAPSIGNWNFKCKSHYWINQNRVEWAKQLSAKEINYGRHQDSINKMKYYNNTDASLRTSSTKTCQDSADENLGTISGLWLRLKSWWG